MCRGSLVHIGSLQAQKMKNYSLQASGLLKVCHAGTCFSDVAVQEFSFSIFGFGKQKSIGN